MMMKPKPKLNLHRPAAYQIKVPGALDERWSDWDGEMEITYEKDEEGYSITILSGNFDQAALQGLLKRIYSLGIPLISIQCMEAR